MIISGVTARSAGKRTVSHDARGLLVGVLGLSNVGRGRVCCWCLLRSVIAASVHHGGIRRVRVSGHILRLIRGILNSIDNFPRPLVSAPRMTVRLLLSVRKSFSCESVWEPLRYNSF